MASVKAKVEAVTLTMILSEEEANALKRVAFSTSMGELKKFNDAIFPNYVTETQGDALLIRNILFQIRGELTR